MKVKTLLLAGGAATMFAASTASADFLGLAFELHGTWTNQDTGQVYEQWRLYAEFSDPNAGVSVIPSFDAALPQPTLTVQQLASDGVSQGSGFWRGAVFGSPASPFAMEGDGSYNFANTSGSGDPGGPGQLDASTYMTIGLANGYEPPPDNQASPLPGFQSAWSDIINNGGGIIDANTAYNTIPGEAHSLAGPDGRVLMAQFSHLQGEFVEGIWNLTWNNVVAGTSADEFGLAFSNVTVPAPGALALLGLAGLVGARRRRK